MYDLKIVNGAIIDGRGFQSYSADIGMIARDTVLRFDAVHDA